jgi:hypothetical protein
MHLSQADDSVDFLPLSIRQWPAGIKKKHDLTPVACKGSMKRLRFLMRFKDIPLHATEVV